MRVTLDTELWLYEEPNGRKVLGLPAAKFADGRGAPGMFAPRPTVLQPGTMLEIETILSPLGEIPREDP